MFLDTGVPVRAKLKVTFRSWHTKKEQLQTIPPFGGPNEAEDVETRGAALDDCRP